MGYLHGGQELYLEPDRHSRTLGFFLRSFPALIAVEGAILLVDGTKGIQAQTLSNLRAAQKARLTIIPAVNKIDLLDMTHVETDRGGDGRRSFRFRRGRFPDLRKDGRWRRGITGRSSSSSTAAGQYSKASSSSDKLCPETPSQFRAPSSLIRSTMTIKVSLRMCACLKASSKLKT